MRAWPSVLLAIVAVSCGESPAPEIADLADEAAGEYLTIGVIDGPAEYIFGDIVGITTDEENRIYVADRLASVVRVYAENGDFVQDIGGPGDGPGEFRTIVDAEMGPDGLLYVGHSGRISIFGRNVESGIYDQYIGARLEGAFGPMASRSAKVDRAGRYYAPLVGLRTGEPPRHVYFVKSDNSPTVRDTIRVPGFQGIERTRSARYRTSPTGGIMVRGLSAVPFEPVPSWDVTPDGTIVGGSGSEYTLYETDWQGDTLQTIRIDRPRSRVPQAERADSLGALRQRLDAAPVDLSQVEWISPLALREELPELLPSFISVTISTNGTLWVETWPVRFGTRRFDELSSSGDWIRTVEAAAPLSTDHPLHIAGGWVYGVIVDAMTGVEMVARVPLIEAAS